MTKCVRGDNMTGGKRRVRHAILRKTEEPVEKPSCLSYKKRKSYLFTSQAIKNYWALRESH